MGLLQISMNIKDITIPLIIHYYLLRAFRTLHKSFHSRRPVSSVSAPGRWQCNTCTASLYCIVLQLFPDTPAEKFPVRAIGHS